MRVAFPLAFAFGFILVYTWGSWWTWVNVAAWSVGVPLLVVAYIKARNYRNEPPTIKPMVEDDWYN